MRVRWLAALGICGASVVAFPTARGAVSIGAQSQYPKAAGRISGVVLDAVSKRPLAAADVSLRIGGSREFLDTVPQAYRVLHAYTDAIGFFQFNAIIAGRYTLSTRKPGYPAAYFGQQSPDEDPQAFDLGQDEVVTGVTLRMWPGAAISGVVRSASGAPVEGRWAQLFQITTDKGIRAPTLLPATYDAIATNARGEYRLAGLLAGQYLLRVTTSEPEIWAMTWMDSNLFPVKPDPLAVYFPNTALPTSAGLITVTGGEERQHVDFTLPSEPLAAYAVGGHVDGHGLPTAGQKIRLVAADGSPDLHARMEIATTTMRADGSFVFDDVPPGTYEIRGLLWPAFDGTRRDNSPGIGPANQQLPIDPIGAARSLWFSERLVVRDAPVTGLAIHARDGARVLGSITRAPDLVGVNLGQIWISARSLDGWDLTGLPVGRAESDGTFQSGALPPGRYLIEPRGSGNNWFAESAAREQLNVLGVGLAVADKDVDGLTIVVSALKARVNGMITDAAGAPRPDARVLCFLQDGSWQAGPIMLGNPGVVRARPNRFGAYDVSLNAGEYFVVAIVGGGADEWQNPAHLQSLIPEATRISAKRGSATTQKLVAIVR